VCAWPLPLGRGPSGALRSEGRGWASTPFCLGRSGRRPVAIDRQELPGAGHAGQLDAATVLEASARADDQVTHGAGDQDFAGAAVAEASLMAHEHFAGTRPLPPLRRLV
jgi:hypothetical protein